MCIIVKKDANTAIELDMLKVCFENNSDGAGFMFRDKGKVEIYKGYMTWKSFKKAVKKFCDSKKEIIFHFRISTSPLTNQGNCHPFPLSDKFEDYQKTHSTVDVAMCHNGVMMDYEKHDNYSDTQHFVNLFLNPLLRSGADLCSKYAIQLIQKEIGSYNKIVVMNGNGNTLWVGNLVTDKDYKGYTFSNTSYKAKTYSYCNYNYGYGSTSNWKSNWKTTTPKTCSAQTTLPIVVNSAKDSAKAFTDVVDKDEESFQSCDNKQQSTSLFPYEDEYFGEGSIYYDNVEEFLDAMTECEVIYDGQTDEWVKAYFRDEGYVMYDAFENRYYLVDDESGYDIFVRWVDGEVLSNFIEEMEYFDEYEETMASDYVNEPSQFPSEEDEKDYLSYLDTLAPIKLS